MNLNIHTGAYGWRHQHWVDTFYPDDLPVNSEEDWRLTYYSNEFNAVLVPLFYWQSDGKDSAGGADCEGWLDDVHEDFRFFAEYHPRIFDFVSMSELIDKLNMLRPRLSGLVLRDEGRFYSDTESDGVKKLAADTGTDVYAGENVIAAGYSSICKNIWRESNPLSSDLAIIENDLTDMKSARRVVENFAATLKDAGRETSDATIIVRHAKLQAADLSRFRSLLELMGF